MAIGAIYAMGAAIAIGAIIGDGTKANSLSTEFTPHEPVNTGLHDLF